MTETQRRNITIAITVGVYVFMLFEKAIHLVIPHQHSHVSQLVNVKGTVFRLVSMDNYEIVMMLFNLNCIFHGFYFSINLVSSQGLES